MFKTSGHSMHSQHLTGIWQAFEITESMVCAPFSSQAELQNWQFAITVFSRYIVSTLWLFVLSLLIQLWGTTESSWCERHGRSSPSESVTSACQMRACTPAHSSPCLSRPPRPFSLFWVSIPTVIYCPINNWLLILHDFNSMNTWFKFMSVV